MYRSLDAAGIRFLRSQLVLVAAGPGTGKSALVLALALRARVPTLIYSADSDAFVQLTRSLSILTGWPLEVSAKALLADEIGGAAEQLAGLPVRMNYNASPTLDDLETTMAAYEEVYGDFPQLVVVDNITNVRGEGKGSEEDPFGGLESLMDYLHGMARETSACVIGLHHVTGPYVDATKPIPLSGVKGQVTRVPEMVLTLHRADRLCVSAVKNRSGRADPSGQTYVELLFEPERMHIADVPADQQTWASEEGDMFGGW
ncbi:hypothetical protein GCM10012275_07800 [Longimycelium tulufanense]|uniref:SF4 helicase domain-containing protein n=1 Tax=Longimycelium tulufanense TaxID=907463 RepID=A0A8J3C861_9PSEU|nr:DnaB-like helicase C-terminal domain-containing protein [Longimycelium tulufanense]GGM39346.1 hypothetical protein GCM10012275_07800 [Longimycelium tulufanense]